MDAKPDLHGTKGREARDGRGVAGRSHPYPATLRIKKFYKNPEQPLQVQLTCTGETTQIYTSYQWKEKNWGSRSRSAVGYGQGHDVERCPARSSILFSYIRTTPGRILLNEMIQKYL
jgi:hypothetical protein